MNGGGVTSRRRGGILPAERQQHIAHLIKVNGSAQIRELAAQLGVSEATVRRDLDELDARGAIERTHGGAVGLSGGTAFERRHEEKMGMMQEEKRRIAEVAASYVCEGDTIFLDSGTTVFAMGQFLRELPELTVITYDILTAYYIDLHPSATVIVTGGIRRAGHNNVLMGSQTERFLSGLRVDKTFLGADALDSSFGVSNSNYMEANIKRLGVEIGEKVFLLTDHGKFDKVALAKVCELSEIDVLITDSGADPGFLAEAGKSIPLIRTV